jgi:hypothetical protein
MTNRNRRAISTVEVLLALAMLAAILLPLVRLGHDTGRETAHARSHLIAHARVQALLDAQEACGWVALPGALPADLPVPALAGGAPRLGVGLTIERLTAKPLAPGLIALEAEVAWATRVAGAADQRRRARSVRILARPDVSITGSVVPGPPSGTPAD